MSAVIDAAYQLVHAYPGGAAALGARMGKNPTTLSHEVRGTGTAKFGLDDAVMATVMSGDPRILNAFNAEAGYVAFRLPSVEGVCDESTIRSVSELAREFGELMGTVTQAAADGRITGNELQTVKAAWSELVAAGQAMVSQLTAKHEAGMPQERAP